MRDRARVQTVSVLITLLVVGCTLHSRTTPAKPTPHAPASSSAPPSGNRAIGPTWTILVDDLHLDFSNTGRLKTLLTTLSAQLIREGDLFAIVSTGPSSIAVDLTSNRNAIDSAIEKVSGAAMKPSDFMPPALAALEPNEERYRAHVALSTAYAVISRLEQMRDRRKAFIFISNGYNVAVSSQDAEKDNPTSPFLAEGSRFTVGQIRDQLAELMRRAKRAQVSIFAIDPRGLAGGERVDPNLDRPTWESYWTSTRNSLRVMSEYTGGFAILNEIELAEGLARINRATRD